MIFGSVVYIGNVTNLHSKLKAWRGYISVNGNGKSKMAKTGQVIHVCVFRSLFGVDDVDKLCLQRCSSNKKPIDVWLSCKLLAVL